MAAGEGCSKAEKRVMVGIDESESSSYALKWVLDNLKQSITTSSLILLMAQPRPNHSNTVAPALLSSARMYCSAASTPELVTSIQERNHMVSVGILEKAKEMCAIHQINAETVTIIGDPKEAICDAVQRFHINLLVLGDHESPKIKRALLGSVSNYCLLNAKCPVLVVKKPAE
nr:universal stress protein A-like protein [Ipomoea batatas]